MKINGYVATWLLSVYLTYRILRLIYTCCQSVFWYINGTYSDTLDCKRSYAHCAHIQNIIFKYKFDVIAEPPSSTDFILTHKAFAHPDYVRKANVTLYSTTFREALFVESEPNVDANSCSEGSFYQHAQYRTAKQLISIPLEHFHTLAQNIGKPSAKLIFINNTGRCGSTLLVQVFESTGHCIGLSEPDAMNALNQYKGILPQETIDKIVVSSVNLLCKDVPGRDVAAYALKLSAPTLDQTPILHRLFPEAIQVFMTRDAKPNILSLDKVMYASPFVWIFSFACTRHPYITEKLFAAMNFPSHDVDVCFKTTTAFWGFMYALWVDKYRKMYRNGIPINTLKFEHLISNPLETARALMIYCKLPEEWAECAVRALEKDSQEQSPFSKTGPLGMIKDRKLSDKAIEECEQIMTKFSLPSFFEPTDLEGTFSKAKY